MIIFAVFIFGCSGFKIGLFLQIFLASSCAVELINYRVDARNAYDMAGPNTDAS